MQLVREEVKWWISHLIKLERKEHYPTECALCECQVHLVERVGKSPQATLRVPSASSRRVQTPQWTIDCHCLGGCWLLGQLSVYCWRAASLHCREIWRLQCCVEHGILPGQLHLGFTLTINWYLLRTSRERDDFLPLSRLLLLPFSAPFLSPSLPLPK